MAMQKSLRTLALAMGAVFLAGSLAMAGQSTPPPAPDSGTTTPQHHAKAGKGKKHSGKKSGHKKGRKKTASTNPK
jgi:hypothetical protein